MVKQSMSKRRKTRRQYISKKLFIKQKSRNMSKNRSARKRRLSKSKNRSARKRRLSKSKNRSARKRRLSKSRNRSARKRRLSKSRNAYDNGKEDDEKIIEKYKNDLQLVNEGKKPYSEVMEYLDKIKNIRDIKDVGGRNLLMLTCQSPDYFFFIQYLLPRVNINDLDNKGNNVLHFINILSEEPIDGMIFKIILETDINVFQKNSEGKTLLDFLINKEINERIKNSLKDWYSLKYIRTGIFVRDFDFIENTLKMSIFYSDIYDDNITSFNGRIRFLERLLNDVLKLQKSYVNNESIAIDDINKFEVYITDLNQHFYHIEELVEYLKFRHSRIRNKIVLRDNFDKIILYINRLKIWLKIRVFELHYCKNNSSREIILNPGVFEKFLIQVKDKSNEYVEKEMTDHSRKTEIIKEVEKRRQAKKLEDERVKKAIEDKKLKDERVTKSIEDKKLKDERVKRESDAEKAAKSLLHDEYMIEQREIKQKEAARLRLQKREEDDRLRIQKQKEADRLRIQKQEEDRLLLEKQEEDERLRNITAKEVADNIEKRTQERQRRARTFKIYPYPEFPGPDNPDTKIVNWGFNPTGNEFFDPEEEREL